MAIHEFKYRGRKLRFTTVSGEVLDTQQRSDTVVSGSGSVSGGYGSTTITSQVNVTRDIWIKDKNGIETHLQYGFEIPVRTGHKLVRIFLEGEYLTCGSGKIEMSLFNANTNQYWWVEGRDWLSKIEARNTLFRSILRWVLIAFTLYVLAGIVDGKIVSDFEDFMLGALIVGIVIGIGFGTLFRLFCGQNKKMDAAIRAEHAKLVKTLDTNT